MSINLLLEQDLDRNLGKKIRKEKGNLPISCYSVICRKVIKRGMSLLDSHHDCHEKSQKLSAADNTHFPGEPHLSYYYLLYPTMPFKDGILLSKEK